MCTAIIISSSTTTTTTTITFVSIIITIIVSIIINCLFVGLSLFREVFVFPAVPDAFYGFCVLHIHQLTLQTIL